MANKREFPRDWSFDNGQGRVVHPSREDYNAGRSTRVGEAYAFFVSMSFISFFVATIFNNYFNKG